MAEDGAASVIASQAGADSLSRYAVAIQAAFPELDDVEPLSLRSADGDCVTVETAGRAVFRFPQTQGAAEAQAKEARLLPFLRGHVGPEVPVPAWQAGSTAAVPLGFSGHGKLPGAPLRAEAIHERNADRLAQEIAEFLLGLHDFDLERAGALDVPGARAWKPGFEALRREALGGLRGSLRFSELGRLRRWWKDFLSDERNWTFEPRLVHGDLRAGRILVDDEATTVLAVDEFGAARVGDAAIDFAGLVSSCGADFSWRVVEAYRHRGGEVDGDFFLRIRRLGAVAPFEAVRRARDGAARAAAVEELRQGPLLGGEAPPARGPYIASPERP